MANISDDSFDLDVFEELRKINFNSGVDWVIMGYSVHPSNTYKNISLHHSGGGGIATMKLNFDPSKIQYGICRLKDPSSSRSTLLAVLWAGKDLSNGLSVDIKEEWSMIKRILSHKMNENFIEITSRSIEDLHLENIRSVLTARIQQSTVWADSPNHDIPVDFPEVENWNSSMNGISSKNEAISGLDLSNSSSLEQLRATHFSLSRDQFDHLYNHYKEKHIRSKEKTRFLVFASRPLDLYLLFASVLVFGGVQKVQEAKLWPQVLHFMGLPLKIDAAGRVLRKHYFSVMEDFERWYFKNQEEFFSEGKILKIIESQPEKNPKSVDTWHEHSSSHDNTPSVGSYDDHNNKDHYLSNFASHWNEVLVRKVSTYGGYDIDFMDSMLDFQTTPVYGRKDLGTVDIYRVLMMLKSGQHIQISEALKILLILSHGAVFDFSLSQVTSLVDQLLLLWKESLKSLVVYRGFTRPSKALPEIPDFFWTYQALFEFERKFNEDVKNSEPATQSVPGESEDSKTGRSLEIGLLITILWRNWSCNKLNGEFLSEKKVFINLLFFWIRVQPSISCVNVNGEPWKPLRPGQSAYKNSTDLVNFPNFCLQIRKNILIIFQNMGLNIGWPNKNAATWVLNVLNDFMCPEELEFHFSHYSLPQNDPIPNCHYPESTPYSLEALEALCKSLSVSKNLNMLSDIVEKETALEDGKPVTCIVLSLWKTLYCNLRINYSFFMPKDTPYLPKLDLVTVLACTKAMRYLASVQAILPFVISDFSKIPVILAHLANGTTWSRAHYYISDLNYTNGRSATDLIVLIAKYSAEALLEIVKHDEAVRQIREKNVACWFNLNQSFENPTTVPFSVNEVEFNLIQSVIHPRLPPDISEIFSKILQRLGEVAN